MRVAVDRDLCEANGVCAGLAPEVFDLDDEDYLHILVAKVPPGQADAVLSAVGREGIRVQKMAIREIPHSGKPEELLDRYGISARVIVETVKKIA